MSRARSQELTADRLRELFVYDADTGEFTRRVNVYRSAKAGQKSGYKGKRGYVFLRITYRLYTAHRLAWLYVRGEWPPRDLDHINGNPSDNRIANLRLATMSQNIANARLSTKNRSGAKGVTWARNEQKWKAQITVHGKCHHLGYFTNKGDAAEAYARAAADAFGAFARPAKLEVAA